MHVDYRDDTQLAVAFVVGGRLTRTIVADLSLAAAVLAKLELRGDVLIRRVALGLA